MQKKLKYPWRRFKIYNCLFARPVTKLQYTVKKVIDNKDSRIGQWQTKNPNRKSKNIPICEQVFCYSKKDWSNLKQESLF